MFYQNRWKSLCWRLRRRLALEVIGVYDFMLDSRKEEQRFSDLTVSPGFRRTFVHLPALYREFMAKLSTKKSWLIFVQDLHGDRLIESDYKFNVLENRRREILCAKPWTVGDSMQAMDLIKKDYQVECWFDDLPGATASYTNNVKTHVYRAGFPLGQIKNDKIYINNHVTFNIIYVAEPSDPSRIEIKGFEVYPDS
ncbi:Endomembrane protein 70-domain-containing protein [Radiomyces spectabilis]|uniref:Endomembrane protein 70-domain-containing protein n=1 Tax=Radiomyces spectabilis TaxID=64574 RepID=UPI00221E63CC|nr:Endomembrane protein 70-domain-containing protein [Radiomyces spectabilis]KAI8367565.1 Endomembrane protein 70-domain-containing protein [Radiomyces spectabilis]